MTKEEPTLLNILKNIALKIVTPCSIKPTAKLIGSTDLIWYSLKTEWMHTYLCLHIYVHMTFMSTCSE